MTECVTDGCESRVRTKLADIRHTGECYVCLTTGDEG